MKWLICFFLLWVVPPSIACDVVDDAGHQLIFPHPAKRIISLAPDVTELLFAAGAGDRIVGVMRGSDYPPRAKSLPLVGSADHIDSEIVLQLQPDLIVTWSETTIPAALKNRGIPIYVNHPQKITDVPKTLRKLGCLASTESIANAAADDYLKRYHALQKHYGEAKPLTVFYQLWSTPLMTVSKKSWIDGAITLCGGNNIFAAFHHAAFPVDMEAVIHLNPDVIMSSDNSAWKAKWQRFSMMNAVKFQQLYTIHPDLIERAGPRLIDGVELLCHELSQARAALDQKNR